MCVYLVMIISTVFLFYRVLVFIERKLRPGVLVFVVRLIQSENHVLMAAKEGIRKKYDHQSQDVTGPEASVLPHSQETNNSSRSTACRFRTAQPTRRDVSYLIKMFHGIYQLFKQLLSQRICHTSPVEKEE